MGGCGIWCGIVGMTRALCICRCGFFRVFLLGLLFLVRVANMKSFSLVHGLLPSSSSSSSSSSFVPALAPM